MITQIQFITEDDHAKRLLEKYGVLECLQPAPPHDHANVIFHAEECYCLATHDIGHSDPNDNGYTLLMIPFLAMAEEDAMQLFAEVKEVSRKGPEWPYVETSDGIHHELAVAS